MKFHRGQRVTLPKFQDGMVSAKGEIVSEPTAGGCFWVRLNSGQTIVAHASECTLDRSLDAKNQNAER
jgi:hypothetical protein